MLKKLIPLVLVALAACATPAEGPCPMEGKKCCKMMKKEKQCAMKGMKGKDAAPRCCCCPPPPRHGKVLPPPHHGDMPPPPPPGAPRP